MNTIKVNAGLVLLLLAMVLLSACAAPEQVLLGDADKGPRRGNAPNEIATLAHDTVIDSLESLGATVSIVVGRPDGSLLFAYDAERQMVPASVQKLGVVADALLHLPRDYRWKTTLAVSGPVVAGVVKGNLYLIGGWDPTLAGRFPYPDWPWKRYDEIAKHLYSKGISSIEGDIVGVGNLYVPGVWEAGDFFFRYAPVVSSLTWNNGEVTTWAGTLGDTLVRGTWPDPEGWSTDYVVGRIAPFEDPPVWVWEEEANKRGPRYRKDPLWPGESDADYLPVPDPRALAVDALRERFRLTGISGGDSTRVASSWETDTPKLVPLLTLESEPIDSVLRVMLTVSSNDWTEMVEATVNMEMNRGRPGEPNWPVALDSLGINRRMLRAADACGLARGNNLTAKTLQELLVTGYQRWGERWLDLMPRPGEVYSTLQDRLVPVREHVAVKTGSLTRNRSLAGYILEHGEPKLLVVVIVNNSPVPAESLLDRFVEGLVIGRFAGEE